MLNHETKWLQNVTVVQFVVMTMMTESLISRPCCQIVFVLSQHVQHAQCIINVLENIQKRQINFNICRFDVKPLAPENRIVQKIQVCVCQYKMIVYTVYSIRPDPLSQIVTHKNRRAKSNGRWKTFIVSVTQAHDR